MVQIWGGVDIGKTDHHCVVIDADGKRLLSRRVANDEVRLAQLVSDVTAQAEQPLWAVDISDGGAAPLVGLLIEGGQPALEHTFDKLTLAGPLMLLTAYQTLAAIRRVGISHPESCLRTRKVRNPGRIAATAVEAAHRKALLQRSQAHPAQRASS